MASAAPPFVRMGMGGKMPDGLVKLQEIKTARGDAGNITPDLSETPAGTGVRHLDHSTNPCQQLRNRIDCFRLEAV